MSILDHPIKPGSLPNRWKILPVMLLSSFMGSLDGSIVNVALPTIAKNLGVGMDGVQWTVSIYLMVVSALVLVFGKIGDLLGKKGVFILGFLIFGLGSLFCALSWCLPILVVARAFQAVGAAMFMATNQGLIVSTFPPNERGRALGFLGTMVAFGTMIGPPLGGVMVEFLGWQSLFLINIPISIFAFVAGARMIPGEERKGTLAGFDLPGSLLFIAFVLGLFYYLLNGQELGWSAPTNLASAGLAAIVLVVFLIRELRAERPMIDLSIFRSSLFSVSIICVVFVYCALFCMNIIQPFYLQDLLGLSPALAGLVLLASPLLSGMTAPFAGYLADKAVPELVSLGALVIELAALAGMCFLGAHSSPLMACSWLALFGIGQGAFNSPNTKLIMAFAPRDKMGIAGSVNALGRNMGMVSGIALAVSILYGVMSSVLGRKVTGYAAGEDAAFISGMRAAYVAATGLLAVAILLTALRALKSRMTVRQPAI